MDFLEGLNEEQLKAVRTTEGYVRVIAGAGSGKTKALTSRYAYLVNGLGISPSSILCATFTNKAAHEMRRRIRKMIGDYDTSFICTFHSFCVSLLREDIHTLNYPARFVVLDSDDIESILKIVYENAGITSSMCNFKKAKKKINELKMKPLGDWHIPYLIEMSDSKLKEKYLHSENYMERIIFGYLYEQKKVYGLDYDDLLTFAIYILNNFEKERKKWQDRLEYIMVDEFQDVGKAGYELVNILSSFHKNLFVVGDPDQTIYTFRGASVHRLLDFDKSHIPTETIIMDNNYRSSKNILNVSNSLIEKNELRMKKELKPNRSIDLPVKYYHAKNTDKEANWIKEQIKSLISSGKSYSDIAVLYRAHFVSRSIEASFMADNIPYIMYSGVEFYQRKEIKDVLSYLRMIVYADDLSFLRVVNVPKRNIGKKRIRVLKEYADKNNCSLYTALAENLEISLIQKSESQEFVELIEKYKNIYKEMTITDVLNGILKESGYDEMLRLGGEQERLDNLAELKRSVFDYETKSGEDVSLENYLQDISLLTNADRAEKKDCIKLMTIHSAKGLEFPYVFVCGLNEGIFPTKHVTTIEDLEEERRLAYVAYTRAKNMLFLSEAEGINLDNSFRHPSRFIFNIDKQYLEYVVELESDFVDDAQDYIAADEKRIKTVPSVLFKKGDNVEHGILGKGTIIDINEEKSSYIIKFDKAASNRSIMFTTPLKKVESEEETKNKDSDNANETAGEICSQTE